MSAKHTKGPWRYDHELGYCGELIAQDGTTIAEFVVEPSLDNARLIAAAPELLEALKQCRLALEPYDDVKPRDWKTDREKLAFAHQAACAAIAKAESNITT